MFQQIHLRHYPLPLPFEPPVFDPNAIPSNTSTAALWPPTWSTKPTPSLFPHLPFSSTLILKLVPRLGEAASCGWSNPRVWRARKPARAASECGSGENARVSRTCPWSSVLCGKPFVSHLENEVSLFDLKATGLVWMSRNDNGRWRWTIRFWFHIPGLTM